MSFQYFAGRATLRRLHQTVQQNIFRRHRLNFRHESTKSNTTTSPPNASAGGSTAGSAGKSAEFTGSYWAWFEPIKVPFRTYSAMQKRSPLMTQLDTTLIIYFLGDLSAQSVQSSFFSEAKYEPIRAVRAMIIGGLMSIPGYKWFLWLGRNFNYPSHLLSLSVKILISQCMFTPLFNSYFFGMQSLLSGSTLTEAWERIRMTVPVSWMNSWKLWPAVTAFSFTFIAPHNRSVFAGCIAIFWQTYLSWLNRTAELAERESKSMTEAAGVPKVLEQAVKT
jgi:hypothetical protein